MEDYTLRLVNRATRDVEDEPLGERYYLVRSNPEKLSALHDYLVKEKALPDGEYKFNYVFIGKSDGNPFDPNTYYTVDTLAYNASIIEKGGRVFYEI